MFALVGPVVGLVPTASILIVAALLGMRAAGVAAVLLVLANTLLYLATGMEFTVAFGASIVAAAFCLGMGVIIARLRSDKRRIERLTVLDRLTGLPNRVAFDTKVQSMVAAGESARIALVDVVGFRDVNESFGHDVGDDVIREIGRRLAAAFRHD